MKGKINNGGYLEIWRKNKYKDSACKDNKHYCNDNCALFGEPYGGAAIDMEAEKLVFTGEIKLSLCHKELIFDEFEDLR